MLVLSNVSYVCKSVSLQMEFDKKCACLKQILLYLKYTNPKNGTRNWYNIYHIRSYYKGNNDKLVSNSFVTFESTCSVFSKPIQNCKQNPKEMILGVSSVSKHNRVCVQLSRVRREYIYIRILLFSCKL